MSRKLCVLLLLIISSHSLAFSQTDKEKAFEKAKKAVELMDAGNIDESLTLLNEACRLDPDNIAYPYEIAYAKCITNKFDEAIPILEKLKDHRDSYDQVYQLLGNSYDYVGNPAKALEIYNEGLKKFPRSGKLLLELGNMYVTKESYDTALSYYEKGIENEPAFPSNYYWACKLYMSTTEKVWGLIYGELFMNLERNSKRTAEISELLYKTYQSQIKISKDEVAVSFSENNLVKIPENGKPEDAKMPFGTGVFEILLLMSVPHEEPLNIKKLHLMRQGIVTNFYLRKFEEKYPNALFDYQKKVLDAGMMEPYNYWILMKGDEEAFKKWAAANRDKWNAFAEWFTNNQIKLDDTNKFFTKQY